MGKLNKMSSRGNTRSFKTYGGKSKGRKSGGKSRKGGSGRINKTMKCVGCAQAGRAFKSLGKIRK